MSSTFAVVISNNYEDAENNINYVLPTSFDVAFEAANAPELVVGENAVTGTSEGNRVVVTTPGSYILSAAEGEENAVVNITYVHPMFGKITESVDLPYAFEVAEGQTMSFIINTADWSESDEINLVLANAHTHEYTAVVTEPTCTTNGFTTYTCSCGESYTDNVVEALGHTEVEIPAVLPTPSNENTAMTAGMRCATCGTITVEPQNIPVTMTSDYNVFGIGSMTLSLKENIGINYKVNVPQEYKKVYMVFYYENQYFEVVDYKLDSSSVYSFNFGETRPHKMEKNVEAYVYGETADGYTMDVVAEYSVMKYCSNQFKKNPNKKELLTVISDVLVYGAAVQRYVYGNTITDADLITSKVEALGYTLTPTSFAGIESGNKIIYDDKEPTEYRWTKVSLMLGSQTELYYRFKAPTVSGLVIKVEYSDQVVYLTEEDIVDEGNGVYRISIGCLTSMQYNYDVKATFIIDGVEASSMTDSINSY